MKNFTLPFDPNKKIFQWGPVPGKFFYTSVFSAANYDGVAKRFPGEIWSKSLYLFRDSTMIYFCDLEELELAGESMFVHHMLFPKKRDALHEEWSNIVVKMNEMSDEIKTENLKNCEDTELLELWEKFHNIYMEFWIVGMVPELANYGSIQYLEKKLSKEIGAGSDKTSIMEALSAPEKLSFYQEEEVDLSKAENIEQHKDKYFWLKNSYNGTKVLDTSFFENRKRELDVKKVNTSVERVLGALQKKVEMQRQFKLSKEIMDIARAVSTGIEWQDERKKYILTALHTQTLFLEEVSRRFGYDLEDLYNCWYFEVTDIIKGLDLQEKLKKRKNGFGIEYHDYCKNLSEKEIGYFWDFYANLCKSGDEEGLVKGTVVSKGESVITTGRVRILLDPHDVGSFQEGEILIAPMTSPEYVFAMKKSSAVVTDVGGLTSHAAIVSRELGVPCVVGTRRATSVFKDGDLVEVNTENSTVKKV